MFNKDFLEEQKIRREKERARARIQGEIRRLNSEIHELKDLLDSFIRKRSDLNELNTEWNRTKNKYLKIEIVRDIEVSKKFEGEVAKALKNELPNGLDAMKENVKSVSNVNGGIDDQIASLNKKIERLNNQVSDAYRRLSAI